MDSREHSASITSSEPVETAPRYSPMLAQYFGMKARHQEAVLLARVGDFYEAYGDDAELIARALQIALTSKDAGSGQRVAMAGVPHHALENYLARLVAQRYVVALAEQLEVPVPNKLVRREVVRIVTPGTLVEERFLDRSANNYLAAVCGENQRFAFAYADVSTGEIAVTAETGERAYTEILAEIARVSPVELVADIAPACREQLDEAAEAIGARIVASKIHTEDPGIFASFSHEESQAIGRCLRGLREYLTRVGFSDAHALQTPRAYRRENFVAIDAATRRHLELTKPNGANPKASLLAVLDKTKTAMGSRLLSRWLLAPLLDRAEIATRADAVEILRDHYEHRSALAENLNALFDLERIAQKVRFRRALPRDLASLRRSLRVLEPLRREIARTLPRIAERIGGFTELAAELDHALLDEPPATLSDGGVIRPAADPELAECIALRGNGHGKLAALEENERAATGIKSLKVKFASAFGYSIEVPKGQLHLVPAHWTRRQTLTAAERFVTSELRDLEAAIASASTRALRLEERIYGELVERVAADVDDLLRSAEAIAEVDVYASLAQIAAERDYIRPTFCDDSCIEIQAGRHPVIESLTAGGFVPNDLSLQSELDRFVLLTGPNMGGKSTFLRQSALLVVLAQIGSFVPAKSMRLGIVDRIFTRIGAGDDLASGHSTFYLEMAETANILDRCTNRSLLLIDEVGRGTGTSDGLAIAQAICEYLLSFDASVPLTLFATHFHELTSLSEDFRMVRNYHVTAVESLDGSGGPIFSHRVLPGSTSRSFGIEVAEMAGLPTGVIFRAREIAEQLTARPKVPTIARTRQSAESPVKQLALEW